MLFGSFPALDLLPLLLRVLLGLSSLRAVRDELRTGQTKNGDYPRASGGGTVACSEVPQAECLQRRCPGTRTEAVLGCIFWSTRFLVLCRCSVPMVHTPAVLWGLPALFLLRAYEISCRRNFKELSLGSVNSWEVIARLQETPEPLQFCV